MNRLPQQILTADALRIVAALQALDTKITEKTSIIIYGSAAVSLYLSDEPGIDPAYTDDIDIHTLKDMPQEFKNFILEDGLHIQTTPIDMWLIHPLWKKNVINFNHLVQTKQIIVDLISPRDLILTKLERYNDRDDFDCNRIYKRYISDKKTFLEDAHTAFAESVGISSSRQEEILRIIEDLMEEADEDNL
jgi:hypothetical protein